MSFLQELKNYFERKNFTMGYSYYMRYFGKIQNSTLNIYDEFKTVFL